jgi:membrane-associated protease RseP (regulator of RpoE activity)
VLGLVVFFVGVMLSIAVHELGHLVAAKRSGARVSEFMVGFGPRLLSFKRGDTRYGLKLLPFGGYVRILGMHAPGRGFDRAETEEEQAILGTDFWRLGTVRRSVTLLAGVTANFLLAAVLLLVVLVGLGLPSASSTVSTISPCVSTSTCASGDTPSPAVSAGLMAGDTLLAIEGTAAASWVELLDLLAAHRPGDRVTLTVDRDGNRLELPAVLAESPAVPGRAYLGITPSITFEADSASRVGPLLWTQTRLVASTVVGFPGRVFSAFSSTMTGAERDPAGAVSLVGAGRIGAELGGADAPLRARIGQLLVLLAGLNVSLAVFNLIPLVPLDGGHVVIVWFEGLRSRLARWRRRADPGPIDYRRLMPITQLVVVFFITASLLLVFADIANPIPAP